MGYELRNFLIKIKRKTRWTIINQRGAILNVFWKTARFCDSI